MKLLYKRSFTLIFLLASLCWVPLSAQTSGGPDEYGYTWVDSNDPAGPAFSWIDISTTGTEITGLADDNSVPAIDMGMDFHYYWLDYNQVKIGSNGWISFNVGTSNIAHCFPLLPTPGGSGDNLVCPLMADLSFAENGNPGKMYYLNDGNGKFIISYHNVPFWINAVPAYTGDNTFQVIFDQADTSITFNYLAMDDALGNVGTCNATINSNSVVGIENITGGIGLQMYGDAMVPPDNYAIRIAYPDEVLFEIADAAPSWNNNDKNGGIFLFPETDEVLSVNVSNNGNTDIGSFDVTAGVTKSPIPADIYSSTATVPALAAGESATVEFPTLFNSNITFGGPGSYRLETTTNLPGDLVAGNNENASELVVLDLSNPAEVIMSYATGNAPDGAAQWSGGGGNSGMGVYYEPPTYPVTIKAIEVFSNPDPNGTGDDAYTIEIRDDDGPNGGPGTLISLSAIDAGSYTAQWNRTDLSFPVTINSGGFYVAWVMQGNTLSIGTEGAGAISRRAYEIISNSWAVYRSNEVAEVLMRVCLENDLINSVDESEYNNSISVFPNPTSDKVVIDSELNNESIERVQLFNTLGELMIDRETNIAPGNQYTLDLNAYSSGIYYLSLYINKERVTRKVSLIK